MAIQVYIPLLNPIRLMQDGHKYYKPFSDSIPEFETQTWYCQPFNNLDVLKFQIAAAEMLTDRYAQIIDLDGNLIKGIPSVANYSVGDLYYVEFSVMLTSIPEGYYLVKVVVEGDTDVVLYSEPIHIASSHENTLLLEYSHDQNDLGLIFVPTEESTPGVFNFRIQGGFASDGFTPASKSDSFVNDDYNVTLLESKPYFTQKLKIGDSKGVPNWVADKVNRIFSCSTVRFNGQQWTKTDGAKMEAVREDIYPMAGWTIEVIRASNSHYDIAGGGDFNNDFNDDFNNIEP